MPSLSAIIITKNEADSIERCVKSVQFADEIIVIDSESNDDTVRIAKQLGAKVFVRRSPGFGPQKNYGAAQAAGDWLLFLDADEEITSDLAREITDIINNHHHNFYWLKVTTVFLNRRLKNIYSYDPRLYLKTAGAWTSRHINEQLQTNLGETIALHDNLSGTFTHPLYHHSSPTIKAHLQHMAEQTALDAQQMAKHDLHRSGRSIRPVWYLPYYLATRQFIKLYLYKHGWLDGYAGLVWCYLAAKYEYTTAKKYLRLKSGQRAPHQPILR